MATATATSTEVRVSPGYDRRAITVLAVGHGAVDMTQGAVSALLPFLILQRGYGYASAAALLLAMTISSSLIQPLFGHLADRRSMPWLLPGGVLVAGIGIALAGVLEPFALTFASVALAGLGVAAYHPEAARYANYVSTSRRASAMSLYSVGGNAGFALGPALATPMVLALGLPGTLCLIVPTAVVAMLLVATLPHLVSFRPARAASAGHEVDRSADRPGAFALVASVSGLRSGVYFGLHAFVPSYYVAHHGASAGAGNAALTVVLASGALGTLVGGRLGDRIGLRPILIGCMAAVPPLMLLFLAVGPIVGVVVLAAVGFFVVGNMSTTVLLGQAFLPSRIGVASGVTLGAAIGVGGLIAALLGILADSAGLTAALLVVAALPLPALLCAIAIPSPDGRWSRVGLRRRPSVAA